jgi:para-nitrobenzyl esterase
VLSDSGTVRGAAVNGVIAWKGIPYAAPPVGALRWRNPQAVSPWSGVKDATRFGPACMQTDAVAKSEDCLTINVWRPARVAVDLLPVMVWIHGGAMVHGSSAIYPLDTMASQGIVMVSMNFRLGRLGYFAHPALAAEAPNEVRGNYGFMESACGVAVGSDKHRAFRRRSESVTFSANQPAADPFSRISSHRCRVACSTVRCSNHPALLAPARERSVIRSHHGGTDR